MTNLTNIWKETNEEMGGSPHVVFKAINIQKLHKFGGVWFVCWIINELVVIPTNHVVFHSCSELIHIKNHTDSYKSNSYHIKLQPAAWHWGFYSLPLPNDIFKWIGGMEWNGKCYWGQSTSAGTSKVIQRREKKKIEREESIQQNYSRQQPAAS